MSSDQFWINTSILILTIFAIIIGPILAVRTTRIMDQSRDKRARKHSILSDLMRTRRARIDPVHVGALNLIELEFYGQDKIVTAYRAYSKSLATKEPSEAKDQDDFYQDRDDLFIELLQQIALELGYVFDKRDLAKLGYFPEGLSRYQNNADVNAALMREILEGRRALPISNFISNPGLFPPAPKSNPQDD